MKPSMWISVVLGLAVASLLVVGAPRILEALYPGVQLEAVGIDGPYITVRLTNGTRSPIGYFRQTDGSLEAETLVDIEGRWTLGGNYVCGSSRTDSWLSPRETVELRVAAVEAPSRPIRLRVTYRENSGVVTASSTVLTWSHSTVETGRFVPAELR